MFCQYCGSQNTDTAISCISCGRNISSTTETLSASSKEELYKLFIGPKNQNYYLKKFLRFDENGGRASISWNWPAFFITFYWFLYRKMWLNSFLYFFVPGTIMAVVAFVVSLVFTTAAESIFSYIQIIYWIAILILPGMYGDYLYYKHCNKKIAEVTSSISDLQNQKIEITAQGRTSGVVLVLLPFIIIALIGILAAIALPAYQDYTVRSRISEALIATSSAQTVIAENYAQNKKMPVDANLQIKSTYAASVVWDDYTQDTGAIIITLSSDKMIAKAADKTILIEAIGNPSTGAVNFICKPGTIPTKYLPGSCR